MSAPLKVTADSVANVAQALNLLTEMTTETGCIVLGAELQLPEGSEGALAITWDEDANAYVIDDRSGS